MKFVSNISFLGNERFKCPEIFFDPSIIGKADLALPQAIHDVIMKVDPEIRDEITENIFVCGGPAYTRCLSDRLNKEVAALFPEREKELKFQAPPGCWQGVYYGASYLPELPVPKFFDSLLSKEQYDEYGVKIVHRMCY